MQQLWNLISILKICVNQWLYFAYIYIYIYIYIHMREYKS